MGTRKNNMVSKQYTNEEKTSIDGAFKTIGSHFELGISLTDKQRKELPNVSKERMPYVQLGLKAAQNYPDILPRNFDEAAFKEDVELTAFLYDVLLKLNDLKKKIEDIYILAGAESYKAANLVREYLKTNHKDNPVYKNILSEMDVYFKKPKTKVEEQEIVQEENFTPTE